MKKLVDLLDKCTAWILSRPRFVLTVAFASALACVVLTAMKLEMQSDQLELISRDHPLIRLTERLEPFKVRTPFTVVIEAPTPDRALAYLHALAPRIEADAVHFQEVSYRVDADRMMKWGLLFLTESDLRHLQEQLDRDAEP
jgi:hypothetical protein